MSERMTDARLAELLGRSFWSIDDMDAVEAEIGRARASETARAAEIDHLKAELALEQRLHAQDVDELMTVKDELARLTPSGQVAEDARAVTRALERAVVPPVVAEALHRLAAKAQSHEAAVAGNAELLETLRGVMAHIRISSADMGGNHRYAVTNDHGCSADLGRGRMVADSSDHPGAAFLKERQGREDVVKALAEQLEWAYREHSAYPDDVHAALKRAGRLP